MTFVDYNWTPILIPFLIGIRNYRSFNKAFKILFFFVVVGVISEISGLLARHLFGSRNTMPQGNLYLLLSFLLLSWYYTVVLKGLIRPKILWILVVIFEVGTIINFLIIGNLNSYPFVAQSASKILYLVYSIAFLYKTLEEVKIKKLWKDPYFLVNISVIIYYSGNLFFSVLFNLILTYSREFSKLTVVYFSVLNALFYLVLGLAFISFRRNQSRHQ